MKVVGLLGAVGAGKTAVAGMLRDLGASVWDADKAAHEVLREPAVRDAVAALLGPEVLGPDGMPDRRRVADRVFDDPALLQGLEAVIHPRVRARMDAWMEAEKARGAEVLVLDVPLLLEAGLDRRCDLLLHVDAPEAVREVRRGWPSGERARRQARQGDPDAKRARAHAVIDNAGTEEAARAQVREFWNRFVTSGKETDR